MFKLTQSLEAWPGQEFARVLKAELEAVDEKLLPLQQALTYSSAVAPSPFVVTLLNQAEDEQAVHIKLGVFFSGVIAGCHCADDPTPMDEISEYCQLWLRIDRITAEARVELITDEYGDS